MKFEIILNLVLIGKIIKVFKNGTQGKFRMREKFLLETFKDILEMKEYKSMRLEIT